MPTLRHAARFGLGLMALVLTACSSTPKESDAGPAPRRVVGYLPSYRDLSPESLDFDTLTHLCVAFANPTGVDGESDFPEGVRARIAPLVQAAHAKDVKVLAAIAGGTMEQGALVADQITSAKVGPYIAGLLDLIGRYDLDGIDVDIEGKAVTSTYEPFVHALSDAMPPNKLLTAAVATKNGAAYTRASLDAFDFINVMAYDHCSWSDVPCDQASMEGTLRDLDYWTAERAYPRRNTVLGVPFYGWCWGCSERQTAMTYAEILRRYPAARTEDWIRESGVEISLNSAATITLKARLAHDYGGLMIWELGQNATGEDSLMRAIAEAQ